MQLIEEVHKTILAWEPNTRYRTEKRYQNDLQEYLYQNLNRYRGGFTKKTIAVKQREKKEDCDIIINRRIGVEVKLVTGRGINNKKLTRLFDEAIKNRHEHTRGVIVVLVGKVTPEIEERTQKRIKLLNSLTTTKSPIKALFEKKYDILLINKGRK